MMESISLIQGSDEWLAARVGKVTASRVVDVMARTKTGWGAGRKNYMAELAGERLTGSPAEQYVNAAMQRGSDIEAHARNAYSFFQDAEIVEVGFVPHPTLEMCGASPDGLIDSDGLVEIKCPNMATHIETLRGGRINRSYVLQMQFQMACTGRVWCDFVSFDPRLPEGLRLHIQRVMRDDEQIIEVEAAIKDFLAELDEMVVELKRMNEEQNNGR